MNLFMPDSGHALEGSHVLVMLARVLRNVNDCQSESLIPQIASSGRICSPPFSISSCYLPSLGEMHTRTVSLAVDTKLWGGCLVAATNPRMRTARNVIPTVCETCCRLEKITVGGGLAPSHKACLVNPAAGIVVSRTIIFLSTGFFCDLLFSSHLFADLHTDRMLLRLASVCLLEQLVRRRRSTLPSKDACKGTVMPKTFFVLLFFFLFIRSIPP